MNYMFKNGKGKASKTATVYIITMVLIWIKFLVEGMTVVLPMIPGGQIVFSPMDPTLIGALVAASGGIYAWRRGQESKERSGALAQDPDDLEAELDNILKGT